MRLGKLYESGSFQDLLRVFVMNRHLRGAALKFLQKLLYRKMVEEDTIGRPRAVQEEKYYMMTSILRSVDRGLRRSAFSKRVLRRLFDVFAKNVVLNDGPRRVKAETGKWPPFFVTLSPSQKCNLRCSGCYAVSRPEATASLSYDVVAEVIRQKRRLWRSYFTVISGGEPFLWRDGDRGLLELAAEFPDEFIMAYTNGTLIDAELAARLEELGNITPAISVEGFEAETDRRRGKGVFAQILRAFENLRAVGVPFGISVTVTRENADLVADRTFTDFFFGEQGAIYGWVFQYMPIGRAPTLDLMVTPEQRMKLYRRFLQAVRDEGLFIVDFWNSGPVTNGCMAAGRPFGYMYIDWNGNVTPCVFIPYGVANVRELFAAGKDLSAVLETPLFKHIRRWQDEYGYDHRSPNRGNWIAPCINRDHYAHLREGLLTSGVKPIDAAAAAALADEKYAAGLVAYGESFRALADEVWEADYLCPDKSRSSSYAVVAKP